MMPWTYITPAACLLHYNSREVIRGQSKTPSVCSVTSHRLPHHAHTRGQSNGLHSGHSNSTGLTPEPSQPHRPRDALTSEPRRTSRHLTPEPSSAVTAVASALRMAPSTLFSDSDSEAGASSASSHPRDAPGGVAGATHPPHAALHPSHPSYRTPVATLGVSHSAGPAAAFWRAGSGARRPVMVPRSVDTAASSLAGGTAPALGWRAAADMATGAYEDLYIGGLPVPDGPGLSSTYQGPALPGLMPSPAAALEEHTPDPLPRIRPGVQQQMGWSSPVLGGSPRVSNAR